MAEPTPEVKITPKLLSVRNLRLPTADAIAKLEAEPGIPDEDRAWLIAKIKKSAFAGVIVDAHESFNEGSTHLHASVAKLFAWLLVALLAFAMPLRAGLLSSTNILTYGPTGGAGTFESAPVLIGVAYIQLPPNFIISDNGVLNTNQLTVLIKVGTDTNNLLQTVATYSKPTTNATDGVISPTIQVSIYALAEVTTTSNLTVGAKAVFNNK